jgi:hypothetical protein
LDLGDKYSYLCLLDTQTGGVLEEAGSAPPPKPSRGVSPAASRAAQTKIYKKLASMTELS